MAELDHLVFTAPDLAVGVDHVESLTGVRAEPGGPHPGLGTHNALLGFNEVTYFEIIAPDPGQPPPDRPRPFGLDHSNPPRLAAYAVHPSGRETIDDVVAALAAVGHETGPIVEMTRERPDGQTLCWRLTLPNGNHAAIPFVIDWGSTPSPAGSLPVLGELLAFEIDHPDPAVRAAIAALDLGVDVGDGPEQLVAVVDAPSGPVALT